MELAEFFAAYEGWSHLEEMRTRQMWEVSRWHGAVSISPHIKDNGSITEMLPLPWDKKGASPSEDIDIEERKARAAEMLKYIKK